MSKMDVDTGSGAAAAPVDQAAIDKNDAEVLDRALFRLASTADRDFSAALNRLLPRVLIALGRGSSAPAIREVCVTICNHINKRVKVIDGVQFPVPDLLAIYAADTAVRRQKLAAANPAPTTAAATTATATPAAATSSAAAAAAAAVTATSDGDIKMDAKTDVAPATAATAAAATSLMEKDDSAPATATATATAASAIPVVVLTDWSVFMSEFTVLYIEKAFATLTPAKRAEYAGLLLDGLSLRPITQQKTILHVFLSCIAAIDHSANLDERKSRFPFLSTDADRALVLTFFSDFLLFTPNQNQMSAAEKKAQIAAADASGVPVPVVLPTGMSTEAMEFVTRDGKVSYEPAELTRLKLSILAFVSSGLFSDNEVLAHGLIAASGGDHMVVQKGEDMLRRLRSVDFERAATQHGLFSLILGSDKTVPESKKRSGASIGLKLLILPHLSRSYFAANEHALALKVVFDCWFGQTSPRLKLAGIAFFTWIVSKAVSAKLAAVAPLYLSGLLKFLASFSKSATPQAEDKPNVAAAAAAAVASDGVPRPMGGAAAPNYAYAKGATGQSTLLDAQLKGNTYNAIGQLGHKFGALVNGDLRMMNLFFKALQDESENGVLQNIHEGLTLLREAYVSARPELKSQLQHMLLALAQHDNPNFDRRVTLCALQCLNRLYPFSDVAVRYLCLTLVNHVSVEIRDEARRGTLPRSQEKLRDREVREAAAAAAAASAKSDSKSDVKSDVKSEGSSSIANSSDAGFAAIDAKIATEKAGEVLTGAERYPLFPAFVSYAHKQVVSYKDQHTLPINARILQQILTFAQDCLRQSAKYDKLTVPQYAESILLATADAQSQSALTTFQALIETAFEINVSELQSTASAALVQLVRSRPQLFGPLYSKRLGWLKKFLLTGLTETRRRMAQLIGLICAEMPLEAVTQLIQQLSATIDNPTNTILVASASSPIITSAGPVATSTSVGANSVVVGHTSAAHIAASINHSEAVHGAILGLGVLVARCVPEVSSSASLRAVLERATCQVIAYLDAPTPVITAAAALSLGRIGQAGPLPLSAGVTTPSTASTSLTLATDEKDGDAKATTTPPAAAAAKPADSKVDPKAPVTFDRADTVRRLLRLLRGETRKEFRVVEHSIGAIGQLTVGDRSPILLRQAVDGLFDLANLKHEEIHFSVGEALAAIGSGKRKPAAAAPASTSTAAAAAATATAASTGTAAGNVLEPASELVLGMILKKIMADFLPKGSVVTRSAACTWLLCVVKYAGYEPAVQTLLPSIQSAFTHCLTESNQFIQEVAAKGMAVVYERGDAKMKDELVQSLVRTFSVGKRKIQTDAEIPLDAKGGYSTYKELCSVANEMGQPDLVYKFMDLASHHSIWNSKLGAAFSLGSIMGAHKALAPSLNSMIPKLYRYQFDTDPKIQSTMRTLWRSLVDNPIEAVNINFQPIMLDLIRSLGAKQFRVRESACLGAADLLTGRKFDQLGSHLHDLWTSTFRVLDDVNDPVRKAAELLAKTLSKIGVRLCDPKYTGANDVKAALAVLMPVLLTKGITDHAKEISTVLSLTKVGSFHLRPHLAELVGTLLEGMSTLEPQAFSYLMFHASSLEMSPEQLESLRMAVTKASPLAEALESCLQLVDADSLPTVLSKLNELMSTGVGLPTLTASANFVSSLVNNSKVAGFMGPHVVPLLKTLSGGLKDQSAAVRKTYCTALGYVCRVTPIKRVGKLIDDLIRLYLNPDSNEKDRLASALACAAIIRRATTQAKHYANELIPCVFMGLHDPEADIEKVWSEAWEELSPGKESGARLYLKEISALTVTLFGSSSWVLKKVSIRALDQLVTLCGDEFAPQIPTALPLVLKALPGRLWDGKELLLDVLATITKTCIKKLTEAEYISCVEAAIAETKRNKKDYKRRAIEAVNKVIPLSKTPIPLALTEMRAVVDPIFVNAVRYQLAEDKKKEKGGSTATATASAAAAPKADEKGSTPMSDAKDGGEELEKPDPAMLAACYECVGVCWVPATTGPLHAAQTQHSAWVFETLCGGLLGANWMVRLAILKSLKRYVELVALQATALGAPTLTAAAIIKTFFPPLSTLCVRDPKYAAVRLAAAEVLMALLDRCITPAAGAAAAATTAAAAAVSSAAAAAVEPVATAPMDRASEVVSAIRALFDELKEDRDPGIVRLLRQLAEANKLASSS